MSMEEITELFRLRELGLKNAIEVILSKRTEVK